MLAAAVAGTTATAVTNAASSEQAPSAAVPAAKPTAPEQPVEKIELSTINSDTWHSVIGRLGISGMPRQLAEHSILSSITGKEIHLELDAAAADHLDSPRFLQRLQDALSASTGEAMKLVLSKSTAGATMTTPAKIEKKRQHDVMSAAKAAINDDPLVQQLLAEVDGKVDENSVQPLNKTDEQ